MKMIRGLFCVVFSIYVYVNGVPIEDAKLKIDEYAVKNLWPDGGEQNSTEENNDMSLNGTSNFAAVATSPPEELMTPTENNLNVTGNLTESSISLEDKFQSRAWFEKKFKNNHIPEKEGNKGRILIPRELKLQSDPPFNTACRHVTSSFLIMTAIFLYSFL